MFINGVEQLVYYQRKLLYSHSGDDCIEDPPVPIPNTEVKLYYAESTDLDTNWEDRELPDFNKKYNHIQWLYFLLCGY